MGEDTMVCPTCGTEGEIGAKCFNCGTELVENKLGEEVKVESNEPTDPETIEGEVAQPEGEIKLEKEEAETGEQEGNGEFNIPVRNENEDKDAESEPKNLTEA